MRLCIVVVLSVVTCSAAEDLPWWKTASFYQVYPRSFKDSDGDGIGDLRGIGQSAEYFKEIGVDAIWLSPIYQSPMADFGYDISNYTAIEPMFGTMEDFDYLKSKLNEFDVKLVLDFVPNHSSDEHDWFQMSVNTSHPLHDHYKDFYVWKDSIGTDPETNKPIPPNNWLSDFSGSAWEWREERQQFYLHHFVKKQPDLNYRNPNVVGNITSVLEFWLDRGVDGFRMDAVKYIYENKTFPDEPPVPGTPGDTYATLKHKYEFNQPETFQLLSSWADVVKKRIDQDGKQRVVLLEVYDTMNNTMKYYGEGSDSFKFPFNFNLLAEGNASSGPADFKRIIDQWMTAMPKDGAANWVVGNHDNGRVADRYGPEMVDAINLLTGVLPGIKVTYNGEEIGMQDTFIRWDQTVDPSGLLLGPDHYMEGTRDPERTPMQWDDSVSAGFSTNPDTWLPVNPNYWWLNVAAQRTADQSHLKVFQAVAQARKDPVLQRGDLRVLTPDNGTLVVIREHAGSNFALLINMGSEVVTYTSENLFTPSGLDSDLEVVVGSLNSEYGAGMTFLKGTQTLTLRPKAAILMKSVTSNSLTTNIKNMFNF